MQEAPTNKMQKKETVKSEPVLQQFTFPAYGIVIEAASLIEAQQKLQEILDKQNKK